MPNLQKSENRERKRRNKRKMIVDGKSTREIWRIWKKRKEKKSE